MNAIRIPIEDVIDLHTFRPAEIPELIEDYIDECIRAGLTSVRIIHGKGTGVVRDRVQRLLGRDTRVQSHAFAPSNQGGTGATVAELKS